MVFVYLIVRVPKVLQDAWVWPKKIYAAERQKKSNTVSQYIMKISGEQKNNYKLKKNHLRKSILNSALI